LNTEELEELEKAYRDDTHHRDLNRRLQVEDELDAEAIAERMKERYGRSELSRGSFRGDVDHVPQGVLIPSVNDPKLWLVRCRVSPMHLYVEIPLFNGMIAWQGKGHYIQSDAQVL
jgi:Spt5 transcription elongation factor, acidic N-terminal